MFNGGEFLATRVISAATTQVMPLRRMFCAFALSAAVMLSPGYGFADSRTVSGLTIPFDSAVDVDSKNVRISVGGKTLLIARKDLDATLVQQVLTDSQLVRKIAVNDLLQFVQTSAREGNTKFVDDGVFGLCIHPSFNVENARELSAMSFGNDAIAAGLRNFFENKAAVAALAVPQRVEVLFAAGVSNLEWVRERALSSLITLKDNIRKIARNEVSQSIQSRQFARVISIAAFLREVFGVDDAQFQETKLVADQLTDFQKNLAAREVTALEVTLVSLKSDQALEAKIFPYLTEEIHRAAREEIDRDKPVIGLRLLSLVDFTYRTATTHSLVKLALDRVEDTDLPSLSEANVRRFILALSQFDGSLKESIERLLERQLRRSLAAGEFVQVDRTLASIESLRPNPDKANDTLRIEYAKELRKRGLFSQSEMQFRAVQGGLPLGLRFQMFAEDSLGMPVWALGLEALAVLLLIILLVNRLRKLGKMLQERREAKKRLLEAREAAEEVPRGSTVQGPVFKRVDKISPERKEYNQCLMLLGLSPNTPFKEIRSAYRKAVKTHHPDMQGKGESIVSDKFVDLNETYERILQLRESLGLNDDQ
jgi:ADP-ribose pyrophosphatase YjhB (NUDIX family)